jgi:hypothetical protein
MCARHVTNCSQQAVKKRPAVPVPAINTYRESTSSTDSGTGQRNSPSGLSRLAALFSRQPAPTSLPVSETLKSSLSESRLSAALDLDSPESGYVDQTNIVKASFGGSGTRLEVIGTGATGGGGGDRESMGSTNSLEITVNS